MVDLNEIVVVNESRNEAAAGDVSIFRNADAACRYLEHWWVEDGEGSAFTVSGKRLTLGVDDHDRVIVVSCEAIPEGSTLVRNWLRAAAASVLQARQAKAKRGSVTLTMSEQAWQVPTSVEELVAYVGFTN